MANGVNYYYFENIKACYYYNIKKTYSRTALSIPPSEIRLNPPENDPWEIFATNRKSILQVYQLIITEQLLSHEEPMSIDQLVGLLLYSYYLPSNVVNTL